MNKFQIANFKAFSDLQTIPLKPITIIFGPNSSGKSSVIHSLLLARHGVDTQSLDVTYPSIAGRSVDLGGFRQYVHRRNAESRLQWVAEMKVSALSDKLATDLGKAEKLSVHVTAGLQLKVTDKVNQISVPSGSPFAQVVEYRIDGVPFLELTRPTPQTDFKISRLNREHAVFEPILKAMLLSSRFQEALNEEDSELLNKLIDSIIPTMAFPGSSDFLPGADMDQDLLDSVSRPSLYDTEEDQFAKLGDLGRSVRLFLPRMLTRFHSGVHKALTDSLKCVSYLGPLRSYPPRHLMSLDDEPNDASTGDAAWRTLLVNQQVRDKVNAWLGGEWLKTPYELTLRNFIPEGTLADLLPDELWKAFYEVFHEWMTEYAMNQQLSYEDLDAMLPDTLDMNRIPEEVRSIISRSVDPDELAEKFAATFASAGPENLVEVVLRDKRYKPPVVVSHRDIGIGISQVLPVLVESFASRNKTLCIEQPEIHLHPALQAELGDVFIESALGEQKNRFVLETHSEHLILRILRRIRETSSQKNETTPAITPDDVALLYVDTDRSGTRILDLRTDKRGRLLDRCPGGFFEEDFEELF